MALDDRLGVHLFDRHALVRDFSPRNDFQVGRELSGPRASMSLQKADHDIGAALLAPVELLERGIGFANAWCDAQVDPMAATGAGARLTANAVQHFFRAGPSVLAWHAF